LAILCTFAGTLTQGKTGKMKGTIRRKGVVEQVEGDKMTVRLTCSPACAGCGAGAACGEGERERLVVVRLDKGESFPVGEKVVVSGRTSQGTAAVFLAFVLPLMGMLAVTAGVTFLGGSEMAAGAWGLLFVGGYFGVMYLLRKHLEKPFALHPSRVFY
jgi:positive regulator of sigma E activity